ncbi:hypothetical protein COV20_01230 [Candidatus Woesearchaeota archaeon CG10_big_fil_rev_8_21_14_0_10_45_16]|nr:MAG: hypothetical protein COV20_01230 [Candidatus Woesearchaeota archaeon CG10_big_fil_rev_8_21_14_0_10_45_16]
MRQGMKIGRVFGIDIFIHPSWWIIFVFLAWVLSTQYFPQVDILPGQTGQIYWFMGIVSALLLFISVLLHELSHSLVARLRKIKVSSITLFFFGGVAGIEQEDLKPSSEFLMAIAGPLFSLLLAGIFYLITLQNGNGIVDAMFFYLAQLNLILGIFNLIPGYPLDGGRAFRAVLYAALKDIRKATKIAVIGGKIFAGALILLGIITLSQGGWWPLLLGAFLYFIAGNSYQQVLLKDVLSKISIKSFILTKYDKVSPSLPFAAFVKKYADSGRDTFVVGTTAIQGLLDLKKLKVIPRRPIKVSDVTIPLSALASVSSKDSAYTALERCLSQDLDLLPVVDKGRVVGIVKRDRLLTRFQWELRFGGKK